MAGCGYGPTRSSSGCGTPRGDPFARHWKRRTAGVNPPNARGEVRRDLPSDGNAQRSFKRPRVRLPGGIWRPMRSGYPFQSAQRLRGHELGRVARRWHRRAWRSGVIPKLTRFSRGYRIGWNWKARFAAPKSTWRAPGVGRPSFLLSQWAGHGCQRGRGPLCKGSWIRFRREQLPVA